MRLEGGHSSEESSSHLTSIADCSSVVRAKKGKERFASTFAVVLEANGSCETLAAETSKAGERLSSNTFRPC